MEIAESPLIEVRIGYFARVWRWLADLVNSAVDNRLNSTDEGRQDW